MQNKSYDSALVYLNQVTSYVNTLKQDNALYQIGRCYYSKADYVNALAKMQEFRTKYPSSGYTDNSYYYSCRAAIKQPTVDCITAHLDLAVFTDLYPASSSLASTTTFVTANCP